MKTHKVLDLIYTVEEGQDCFDGTRQECEDFVALQPNNFMYKVVPMTTEEIENHPDNKSVKVVGSIDLSKFEKPVKIVKAVDIDTKKVGDLHLTINKPTNMVYGDVKNGMFVRKKKFKLELKLKDNKLNEKMVIIYTKERTELGDPEPIEVNKAFNLIKEIEKTEKGLNFLNHLARVFSPYGFNYASKILEDGSTCCMTGKKIAGLLPLSQKLAEVTPVTFTAKKILGELTQDEIDERNQKFSEMPEEYKVQRIGYLSPKSDKTISVAGFIALRYYLLEDNTRLLKFEIKQPSFEELVGIPKETPEQYAERRDRMKMTTPKQNSFGLGEKNINALQSLRDKLK